MDNTKIFIDIDDEITFIAERIFAAPTQNVILVIPEKASIIGSLASLKLLHYVIAKTPKKVVVVTMDEMGIKLSEKAGFKIRNRVGEVDPAIWADAPKSPIPLDGEPEQEATVALPPAPEDAALPVAVVGAVEEKALEHPPQETISEPLVMTPQVSEIAEEAKQEDASEKQPEQDVPEVSLKDVKAKNPPIYELHSLDTPSVVQETKPEHKEDAPQKQKYVTPLKIVNIDGFELVVGGDIAAVKSSREISNRQIAQKADAISSFHEAPDTGQDTTIVGQDVEAHVVKKKKITKLHKNITAIMQTVKPKKHLPVKYMNKTVSFILGGVVLLLFCIFFFGFMQAKVTLHVESSSVQDTSVVNANINVSSVDIKNSVIPASYIEVNESSSSSLNTTGSKLIGNPATGTVLIYNLTKAALTIPKGSILITNDQNALKYTTNADTTIPASVSAPQSQSVSVTASDIGASYNIGENVPFVLQDPVLNASTTVSSNVTFQGGTSSTAQVVAQADQDNLLKSLEAQLYSKGSNELQSKFTDDMIIVKDSQKNEDVTKTFDGNVGDKATILNLSLTTKTSVLVYKKSDLAAFAKQALEAKLQPNQDLHTISWNGTYQSYDSGSGNIAIKIQSTGAVTQVLKTHDIIGVIKGKPESNVRTYLKTFSYIKQVQFTYSPQWLGIFHFLPVRSSNISIQIVTI